ncbi:MAG: serine--tRNA ligase, partial [Thermogutta sp.]|nr:serine--tRNA ligase [Thermogutta sp.]
MLDRRWVVEHLEEVKRNCAERGVRADVDRLAELENRRRDLRARWDACNRRANEIAKALAQCRDEAERQAKKEEGRRLREEAAETEREMSAVEAEADALLRMIPNLTHPEVPRGGEENAREIARGAAPLPHFDFPPLDHVQLAEKLDLIDFEAAARVTGHGFYFLKNEAVLLELALQRYALDVLLQDGFIPMTTPDLARNEVLEGIGFLPRGPETQIYSIENSDLSLIATAEIT